jgi:hypothetical protein
VDEAIVVGREVVVIALVGATEISGLMVVIVGLVVNALDKHEHFTSDLPWQ